MTERVLRFEPSDLGSLEAEARANLRAGGCFVPGATGWQPNETCTLEIVRPADGAVLAVEARVVMVSSSGPRAGVGLTLEGFDEAMRSRIESFVATRAGANPAATPPPRAARTPLAAAASAPAMAPAEAPLAAAPEGDAAAGSDRLHAAPLAERLRGLNSVEQLKIARSGEAHERTVLERLYGKAVWPALVANARLTVPEVARLARMGNMPRPQLETIVGNGAWLQSPQVRRALLANPRLTRDMVRRVLRATPKHELKLVLTQTAYSHAVRAAAREMLHR